MLRCILFAILALVPLAGCSASYAPYDGDCTAQVCNGHLLSNTPTTASP